MKTFSNLPGFVRCALAVAAFAGSLVPARVASANPCEVPFQWSANAFFGTKATLLGEINGGPGADLVAIDDQSTWVMLSTRSSFGPPQRWADQAFFGTKATLLGDVNGDDTADLVAVDDTSTWVMLSSGSSFGPPTLWSDQAFFGTKATLLGDVDGDFLADVVAVNDTSAWVMLSGRSSFGPPTAWSSQAFFGTRATLIGDINSDGRADLVAFNDNSTWVMQSSGIAGGHFVAPIEWLKGAFWGTHATLLGDVDGDGGVDGVAVDDGSSWTLASCPATHSCLDFRFCP